MFTILQPDIPIIMTKISFQINLMMEILIKKKKQEKNEKLTNFSIGISLFKIFLIQALQDTQYDNSHKTNKKKSIKDMRTDHQLNRRLNKNRNHQRQRQRTQTLQFVDWINNQQQLFAHYGARILLNVLYSYKDTLHILTIQFIYFGIQFRFFFLISQIY